MLKNLKYNVTFASTLKSLSGDYNFETGLTAITGPNESGKSMIVEMIRYALFGTKALRASASSYKALNVDLTFVIREQTYTVKRSKTGSDVIMQGATTIVSGTKPVNQAVEKLLGYNLEVFDVSNACLQGQVEALSNKTPAERKRMVERTIGLDAIERMIKHVSEKVTPDKRAAEALKSTLQSVEEPEKPQGYVPSDQLSGEIAELQKQHEEFIRLNSWLVDARVEEPEEYKSTIGESLESLLEKEKIYDEVKQRVNYLSTKLEGLPSTCSTSDGETLRQRKEALNNWEQYKEIILDYPEPPRSQEWINEQRLWIKNRELTERKSRLQELIAHYNKNCVECPHCHSEFSLENDKLAAVEAELAGLPQDTSFGKIECTEHDLKAYENMIHRYSCRPDIPMVEEPEDSREQLVKDEIEFQQHQEYLKYYSEYVAQVQKIDNMNSMAELIIRKRKEIDLEDAYKKQLEQYMNYADKKEVIEQRVGELQGVDVKVSAKCKLFTYCKIYEQELERYHRDKEIMEDREAEIKKLEEKINSNENVKKGLKDLKPKVKMFLVPSLNKVSSILISQMTQGERNRIQIDEDFNIKVDGQAIEELSGSGKSVANLAIRIGLGTVLTNKVFSVFLADEVDAAMDKDRAAYTAECLRNLKSTVNQVVIVSHQKPDADHQIELRK